MKTTRWAIALLTAALSMSVCAADKWFLVPSTDWYWHTPANWGGVPAGLPAASTSVSITKTGEAVPVQILAGEAYTVKSLALGESYQGPAYCGHLSVAGAMTNVTGLTVGGGGKGVLRIQEGGAVAVTNGAITVGAGAGVYGAVTMTNGGLEASQHMRVGESGTGLVFQAGGTVMVPGFISMGYASGASGAYTNLGGRVAVGYGGINVGVNGRATFYQSGGSVTSGLLHVGFYASGQGEYVNEDGVLTVTNNGYVGEGGLGRMVQLGGRQSFSPNLFIGYEATGSGVYTNTGGYLGVLNVFYCGYKGAGEYVQIGGTNALANWLSLGQETNSTGRYVLQTGVVSEAANQTFRIGKFGNGSMLFQGGTVSMAMGSKLVVRGEESGTGVLRGWGDFSVADATPYVVNNGLVIADGGGSTHDLNLADFIYATNALANGAAGTNGWYAVNKGRLRYPRAWLSASLPERGLGTAPADPQNDLVNSLRLSFTGIVSEGYLRGELYAADRDDIPGGIPSHNKGKIVGVWRLPMTVPFGKVSLRVRYDREAVRETDRIRLYRYDGAGTWTVVGTTNGTVEAVSTAAPLAPLSAANGYLGWFSVVAFPNTGTLVRVN